MTQNLVNLNVNPCKMCMPMGSATAFYGIARCMTILHGSQGCATYIRRHMATHYNEPVDIASTSLTEEGTVFGGEKNLLQGLKNMVELYRPEVIGVATTCLAETIGEDVERYIETFHEQHPELAVKIIPVAAAGYGGSQYEGYWHALRSVVSHVDMDASPNQYLNIIPGLLSPADVRALKDLLDQLQVPYLLLPDLSDNLDGVHTEHYERLPQAGITLAQISKMAGSRATLELSLLNQPAYSPGTYLRDTYGVPLYRLNLPGSLRDTDALISVLKELGAQVPERLRQARGRFLDAMADSHKYNAAGRAVIFGEPDFVLTTARLCCENGLLPVLCATGAHCKDLAPQLEADLRDCARRFHVAAYKVLDDCDFDTIEREAQSLGANLMIGSSDGRRVAQKLKLPLIRCAFPCHDQVGGQRVRTILYDGCLSLLDRATNALLNQRETGFRQQMYDLYYKSPAEARFPAGRLSEQTAQTDPAAAAAKAKASELQRKTAEHPCFNGCGGQFARMHLPVAPACNIQCNYCVRKYDCANESRPGVTTEVLTPQQASEKYRYVKSRLPELKVVGIAGPGDSLAEWDKTRETLELIRQFDTEVTFCLSTNGLLLPQYADQLARLGVSHVTVTLNTIDPAVGAKIYQHVEFMGKRYTGETAAALLLANQLAGIRRVCVLGLVCKVNIVMLKGINDQQLGQIVQAVKDLGCHQTNIMQMIPVAGAVFEHMPLTSNKEIMQVRRDCSHILKQMNHCQQCRADAIGTLGQDRSREFCHYHAKAADAGPAKSPAATATANRLPAVLPAAVTAASLPHPEPEAAADWSPGAEICGRHPQRYPGGSAFWPGV
ncbi:MAG: nitrogenase cofactor biosynthesis protein NifB [Oscillospiraceae bacterium]|nr:nitrogenase cofactor biosynthesis protein NifB [Oscillospiraceae bacterium]